MKHKTLLATLFAATLITISGCAKPETPAVFYPPEPAPPRFQHLKTYTSEADFRSDILNEILGDSGDYRLGRAFGIAFGANKIYVVDTNKAAPGIAIFDLVKEKLKLIRGPLRNPIDIAVDSNGLVYVTDQRLKTIVVFDQNDAYLNSIPLENINPAGVSIIDGKLYVADITNGHICIINKDDGKLIRKIGEDKPMFWPSKVALNPASNKLLVTQTGAALVTAFDLDGNFQESFGKPGDAPGDFVRPKSLDVDDYGNIYVVDVGFQNVQVFDKDYRVLTSIGGSRRANFGHVLPAGIALDKQNVPYFQEKYAAPGFTIEYLIAVTSQGSPSPKPGNHSAVDIYGFGRLAGADYGDN